MKRYDEIARSMIVLPRLMHHLAESFQPNLSIPVKRSEVKTLFEMKEHPGMMIKHYQDAAEIGSGAFTYLADKMEAKGLIRRVTAEDDKRKTVLELTEAGKRLCESLKEQFDAHVLHRLSCLNAQELEEMSTVTNTLARLLKKMENHSEKI